ncbi:DNA-3-methyladenine glycosylase 2 [Neobacillus sp. FSL H8-0543]|uniref:DNA-3-methyladenine glycosylase family protein n=1 Tax=Neobacillus sp. FSL H8-0543 TaxID=2954672 RepID=UPI0031595AEC
MNWMDHGLSIEIIPPKEFNFNECLVFLGRSENEILHQIRAGYLYKLVKINGELILLKIGSTSQSIHVEFPIHTPSKSVLGGVAEYVWEWFDLDQELGAFYQMARQDRVLASIADKYYGLRIMCIPDLFEALTWAIIGQQINLTFAYTLKKRFVEQFGECQTFKGQTFWFFPTYEKIASIEVSDLRELQFSVRKAEYVIGIAQAMTSGQLTKEDLLQQQEYQLVHRTLTAIRGVGAWTADYVMMKCLHHPAAFPIADVGLHNALKLQLGLERKPTIEEIRELASDWNSWQAYATFYLWRSLYE